MRNADWIPTTADLAIRERRRHDIAVRQMIDASRCPGCGHAGFAKTLVTTGRVHRIACACGWRYTIIEPEHSDAGGWLAAQELETANS